MESGGVRVQQLLESILLELRKQRRHGEDDGSSDDLEDGLEVRQPSISISMPPCGFAHSPTVNGFHPFEGLHQEVAATAIWSRVHDLLSLSSSSSVQVQIERKIEEVRNLIPQLRVDVTIDDEKWKFLMCASVAYKIPELTNHLLRTSQTCLLFSNYLFLDNFTALHLAVIGHQVETVSQILEVNPSRNFELLVFRSPEYGLTALHLAVSGCDLEHSDEQLMPSLRMLRMLIKAYPKPLPETHSYNDIFVDNFGMTPVHYAVRPKESPYSERMLKELLRASFIKDGLTITENKYRLTALHIASLKGNVKLVKQLIKEPKVDVNAVDCCSYTPLHWAVHEGRVSVVNVLVSQNKKPLRADEEAGDGRTPLRMAVEFENNRQKSRELQKMLMKDRNLKDVVDTLYRDRQVYVDAANAILVGAALIASVTFAGWLQPPLGYQPYYETRFIGHSAPPDSYRSYAAVLQDSSVRVFWVFNSLSFFFAIATVLCGAGSVLPVNNEYIGEAVHKIRRWLVVTSALMAMSVLFVLGAFTAAGYAALPPIARLERGFNTTVIIGMLTSLLVGISFTVRLYMMRPDWTQWRKKMRLRLLRLKEVLVYRPGFSSSGSGPRLKKYRYSWKMKSDMIDQINLEAPGDQLFTQNKRKKYLHLSPNLCRKELMDFEGAQARSSVLYRYRQDIEEYTMLSFS